MQVPIPADENARQGELDRYAVLDSLPEPSFDKLAMLAARALDAPMAFISLIDRDRQWFKARYGIELAETERSLAFCAHTILTSEVLQVPDAASDLRFSGNPLVLGDPKIRFYAGAPLITPSGHRVGTLAVLDQRPRALREGDAEMLQGFAALAVDELELRLHGERQLRVTETTGGELRRALDRLELVARATNDVIWDWDLVTGSVWWNAAFAMHFGQLAEGEAGLESWTSRLHSSDAERVIEGLHRVIDSGGTSWADEYRFRRADGSWADVLDRGYVIQEGGKPVRMIGAMLDLSERMQSERAQAAVYRIAAAASASSTLEELLASVHLTVAGMMAAKNFFVALYDQADDSVEYPYYADERGDLPPKREKLGRGLTAYVLRRGEALLLRDKWGFQALRDRGEVELVGEPSQSWVGVPLKSGERVMGMLAAQIYEGGHYTDADRDLLQFVSTQVAHAIERKRGERALRASEHRLRALIEHSADGIAVLSAANEVVYRSASGDRIMGFARGEPAPSIFQSPHPDDRKMIEGKLAEVWATPGVPVTFAVRVGRSDQTFRQLEVVATNLINDPAIEGVVVNFRDVTERKAMEARLMMADRMVSVGTLAAGVAHEINNPLAYVVANLDLVAGALTKAESLPEGELLRSVRDAQEGAERVRKIVRDLKTFSRSDEDRRGPVDVRAVIDASANLAWNEIRHRARLVKDHARDLPKVNANESRLAQVLLNLLVNAAQAIPEGAADQNEIRIATRVREGRVIVSVSDTGGGIPKEALPRIFDPFFTTKPPGEGTGLGLFICQNIIAALGGTITVESAPGKGTTFSLDLPIDTGSEVREPVRSAPPPVPALRGRVLVLDDEPMVGLALRRGLSLHEVSSETAAEAALARFRAGERFDVILCDLMMPQMTGQEFFEVLTAIAPDQAAKVIFITGGAFTSTARSFMETVPNLKISKPFDVRKLRAIIDEQLSLAAAKA